MIDRKHLHIISSGQGAPSTLLIWLAGQGLFQCDAVIVADTGWETDLHRSDGERVTNREYFNDVTKPLAKKFDIPAYFVRSKLGDGSDRPPIDSYQLRPTPKGSKHEFIFDIPLYGKDGGKSRQSCTELWKIRAVRQQMRRLGATSGTVYLGLTMDEVHRIKPSSVKWIQHDWPLVMPKYGVQIDRMGAQRKLKELGILYLRSTQCDGCPHKGLSRWRDTSPRVIDNLAKFEAKFKGEWYLTRHLIPLHKSIEKMEAIQAQRESGSFLDKLDLDDMCDSGYCFV